MSTWLKRIALATIILFIAIQVIPYGRNHENPAVGREYSWNSPTTRQLAKRACFDCHSHETVWPWYSRIAPVSWLVYHDVVEGREYLNFSDWRGDRKGESAKKMAEEIRDGEMPPVQYRLAHPEASLTDGEKQQLVSSLETSR
jgi:hypothetical protein